MSKPQRFEEPAASRFSRGWTASSSMPAPSVSFATR